MSTLTYLSAVEVVALLRKKETTPTELLDASYARIEETDSDLGAMVTLCEERAYEQAAIAATEHYRFEEEPDTYLGG